jgi:(p)ppGpp synthase/HD superfamily hydrolase
MELKYELSLVEQAIKLASVAHMAQVDKSGKPFIMHPLRVATYYGPHKSEAQTAAAILHDIVEDTWITLADLSSLKREYRFPEETVHLVDVMTRREGETYRQYIYRVGEDREGISLKLADLADNMDPRRATTPELRGMINSRYVWTKKYLDEKAYIYDLRHGLE